MFSNVKNSSKPTVLKIKHFKDNKNKFKSLYNVNTYRSLENVRLSNVPEASISQEIGDILDMKCQNYIKNIASSRN